MNQKQYEQYTTILREELVPAMGCTEPIAVAYAAACARKILGKMPDRAEIEVCGNILKNVKSVVVPNTGGQRGVIAAAAAGIVAGDASKKLLVIADLPESCHEEIRRFAEQVPVTVKPLYSGKQLDILIRLFAGEEFCSVRISDSHTKIVEILRNGQVLLSEDGTQAEATVETRREMSLAEILEYAETVPLEMVSELLNRQIDCNSAIAEAGLQGGYGSEIGRLILEQEQGVLAEAVAYAAAGSDARMNGCELPVVIVAGSGNQGMTTSLPVIRYAKHLGASREALYRALLVSNLVTLYQKEGIGKLSAFCGAVSAGCGATAGIAWLETGDAKLVAQTICNTLAITPGIVCDGAKSSCAAKIAASVRAGLMAFSMAKRSASFPSTDGLLGGDADQTIAHVGRVAREGMAGTDRVIIDIMCGC
ncbi:MAG: serine dehydratase subunit alpha family protein [Vescimonas sp.]